MMAREDKDELDGKQARDQTKVCMKLIDKILRTKQSIIKEE